MASNYWSVDFGELEQLTEKFKQIEGGASGVINKVIHNDGVEMALDAINPKIPVSHWKNAVRKKKHARDDANPQVVKKSNMAFVIKPKPKYNYLKYPDLAIGTSKNNPPQHFMRKGLQEASPPIIEKLGEEMQNFINENIGGN